VQPYHPALSDISAELDRNDKMSSAESERAGNAVAVPDNPDTDVDVSSFGRRASASKASDLSLKRKRTDPA
jgi:hypothetical protein